MGLRRVLTDLSVGMPIEASLTRYIGRIQQVDAEFAAFARQRADSDGESLDWTPDLAHCRNDPCRDLAVAHGTSAKLFCGLDRRSSMREERRLAGRNKSAAAPARSSPAG